MEKRGQSKAHQALRGLGEETRTLKLFFIKILSPAPWGIGLIVVYCLVGLGGSFLNLRKAYISNMSLLLGLEPFQKYGVVDPEIIIRNQRLYNGQKVIKSSALVETFD